MHEKQTHFFKYTTFNIISMEITKNHKIFYLSFTKAIKSNKVSCTPNLIISTELQYSSKLTHQKIFE